jgi:hypothetical protein
MAIKEFSLFEITKLIKEEYGIRAALLPLVLFLIGLAWWNFDKLKTLPISGQIIQSLSEASLPRASGKFFSVGFVHLEGDKDGEYEKLLHEELKSISGIEVLQIDRNISSKESSLLINMQNLPGNRGNQH